MKEIKEETKTEKVRNRRVHMANERTFLAWIRTSIGIMAFGFVVEKFALFLKQISAIMGRSNYENALPPSHRYSAIVGIFLISLGALIGLLAFVRYRKIKRQIDTDTYDPSSMLNLLLFLSILAVGIFLTLLLVQSI